MQAFVTVAEAKSFVLAAKRLGFSTAQMSRLVSDLEAHLQTRLFNRTTRSVVLTAAGERYLEKARAVLESVAEAESEARSAHTKAEGVLRVHCLASFAMRYIVPLIASYRQSYPDVTVELTLSQRIPKLTEEGYDVAILLSPEIQDAGVFVRRLTTSYSVVCASKNYLAKQGVPQTPDDLSAHACLNLVPPCAPDRWEFSGPDGAETVPLKPVFTVNLADAMIRAIGADMGVGLLPGYVALEELDKGSVIRVLPDYRMREIDVLAIYPSRRFLNAKIATWLEHLERHLPDAVARDRQRLETEYRRG